MRFEPWGPEVVLEPPAPDVVVVVVVVVVVTTWLPWLSTALREVSLPVRLGVGAVALL